MDRLESPSPTSVLFYAGDEPDIQTESEKRKFINNTGQTDAEWAATSGKGKGQGERGFAGVVTKASHLALPICVLLCHTLPCIRRPLNNGVVPVSGVFF